MSKINLLCIFLLFALFSSSALAHVPYFEHLDYTEETPRIIRKNVEQSKAFYSWLDKDNLDPNGDIDVFQFKVSNKKVRIYVEIIVPIVEDYYENFLPWYAVVGPNLPEYNDPLPFEIPEGYGAIVMENTEPGEERKTFYEPFGGKSYYEGPVLDTNVTEPGNYYVYTWDPYESGGDYVLVFGKKEIFGFFDIIRALIYTPMIRLGMELHIDEGEA